MILANWLRQLSSRPRPRSRRRGFSASTSHSIRNVNSGGTTVEQLEVRALLSVVQLFVSGQTRGESGSNVVTVTAATDTVVTGEQTIDLNVSGDGITAADYTLSDSTLIIPDGSTSGSVTFTVLDDAIVERGVETAVLTISNLSAGLDPGSIVSQAVDIQDNDAAIVALSGGSAAESDGAVEFTVSLSQAVDVPVEVTFATGDGTATAPGDYIGSATRTVTIPAGSQTATISVPLIHDGAVEASEDFTGRVTSIQADGRDVSFGNVRLTNSEIVSGDVSTPRISPDGSTVVYRADQDTDEVFELYSVPIGGGAVTKLSGPMASGGDVEFFRYQVTETMVVYMADQDTDGLPELYSVPLHGGTVTKLNAPLAEGGRPHSDFQVHGSNVLYRSNPDPAYPFYYNLYSVPVAGGPVIQLNVPFFKGDPQVFGGATLLRVSADGATVFYIGTTEEGGPSVLYSVPVNGGASTRLSAPQSEGFGVNEVRVSGSTVVYKADTAIESKYELYTVPITGGTATKISGQIPDQDRIRDFDVVNGIVVYLRDRGSSSFDEIYRVALADRIVTRINGPMVQNGGVKQFKVIDGNVVYVADGEFEGLHELYSRPLSGGPIQKLSPGAAVHESIEQYSGEGGTIVYRARLENGTKGQLFSVRVSGGSATAITEPWIRDPFGFTRFYITDSTVVYELVAETADGTNVQDVYSVPIQGGAATKLNPTAPGGFANLVFGGGPTVVFYGTVDTPSTLELFSTPLQGGTVTKLSLPMPVARDVAGEADRIQMTVSGSNVFFLADLEVPYERFSGADPVRKLYTIPLSGGDAVELSGALPLSGDVQSYQVAGSTVVYLADQDTDGLAELYRVPTSGGVPAKLNAPSLSGLGIRNDSSSGDRSPFSIHGTTVIYVAGRNIYSVPLAGGTVINLTETFADTGINEFSVRGTDIVFTVFDSATQTRQQYSIPMQGGALTPLSGRAQLGTAQISGSTIVYADIGENEEPIALYSVPVGGGTAVRLSDPVGDGGGIRQFTVQGATVVYRANQKQNGAYELYSVPITGGTPTKLNRALPAKALTENRATGILNFRIIGHTVVYHGEQDVFNQFELYSVPLQGGTVTKVSGPLIFFGQVSDFNITDSHVVYRADQELNEAYELYSAPLHGGPSVKLSPPMTEGRLVDYRYNRFEIVGSDVVFLSDAATEATFELFSTPLVGGTPARLNQKLQSEQSVAHDFAVNDSSLTYRIQSHRNDTNFNVRPKTESFSIYTRPVATQAMATILDSQPRTVPTILGPMGTIDNQTPTITWTAVADAISYDVEIILTGDTATRVLQTTVNGTSLATTTNLGIGRFRVWVRANLPGGTRSAWTNQPFSVSLRTIVQDLPLHGTDRTPTVTWDNVNGATAFQVYISNLTTGQHGLIDVTLPATSTTYTPTADLTFGRHRIWVRAIGGGSFAAAWSTGETYYIGPELVAPSGAILDPPTQFSWTSIPGAASYQLYVAAANGEVLINESGIAGTSFTTTTTFPTGDYRWWLRASTADGRVGIWSAAENFITGGRTKVLSHHGAITDNIPKFEWPVVPTAQSYEVYVAKVGTSGALFRKAGLTDNSYPSLPLEDGRYRVWVRTTLANGSSSWGRAVEFTVNAPTTGAPTNLLSPVTPGFDAVPQFTWQAAAEATAYDLYLQDGTNAVLHTALTSTSWTPPSALARGTWSWNVRSRNAAGIASPWSTTARFSTSGLTQLLTPSSSTTDVTPVFTWRAVTGAGRYILQVDNRTTGTSQVIRENNLTSEAFIPLTSLPAGEYRAWVRAISAAGTAGPWSSQFDFEIAPGTT